MTGSSTATALHDSYVFPASYGQQRLWLLCQLDPAASRAYHLRVAVEVSGPLDVNLLTGALNVLIERHEALRTRFVLMDAAELTIGEQLAQVVAPAGRITVRQLDLTGKPDATVWQELSIEAGLPFDLEAGPLLRGCVARLGPDRHVLLLTMHHIIGDGWSMAILGRELSAVYEALAAGCDPDLPELPVQYADVAIWQREQQMAPDYRRAFDYWQQTLAGLPPLDLPTDRLRPTRQSYRGSRVPVRLPASLVTSVAAIGRAEGATPFMVLLAAWQAVLGRISGKTDFGVGTPVSGRTRPETEPLIGFFVNTVVLRADLSGRPTFEELVRRVRDRAMSAYRHQEFPFEKLVEELVPKRDLSHSPLFQAWFGYQDTSQAALWLADAAVAPVEVPSATAAFDLALALRPSGEEVTGWLEYNSDLFDESTAQRLADHWLTFLAGAAARPSTPVWALPLLTDSELVRLQATSGRTVPTPHHRCLPDAIDTWVRQSPDADAVRDSTTRLSYRELDRRVNRLTHWLDGRGVLPGQVVGVCVSRTVDLVATMLAVWKCGAAYLPLDPDFPEARREFMVADSDARFTVTDAELSEQDAHIRSQPDTAPGVAVPPNALAYVIYTSGSTGVPKGVMVTHESIAAQVHQVNTLLRLLPGDVWAAVTTVSFDPSGLELFGPLASGATVALLDRGKIMDPERLARQLGELDVAVIQGTPALWRALAATGWHPAGGTRVLTGGEALPADLAASLTAAGAWVWNVYGPTETTVWSTAAPVNPAAPITLGRPLPGWWTCVLDDHLRPTPVGVVGELYIGGAGVACGYQARPGLTAQRFLPDPFEPGQRLYRSGDLVRLLPNGELLFQGRQDDQIKLRGGFRVELGEVESVLNEHPCVGAAAVVARGGTDRTRLVGYIESAPSASDPIATELTEWIRQRLPDYMVPSEIHILQRLPLTPTGKVDRKALPDLVPEPHPDAAAPRTPLQAGVLQLVRRLLGREDVGVVDNFFEVGGNSMLAVRLVAEMRSQLDLRLSVAQIFELGTVEQIALAQPSDRPAVVPRPPDAKAVLSFDQQRLWLEDQLRPGVAYNVHGRRQLRGRLDVATLETSIRAILGRHEALRTRFSVVDGVPVQVVDDADEHWKIPYEDVSGLGRDRDSVAHRLADRHAATVLDLARGPLFRCLLIKLGETDHLLSITMHHIVSDAWSIGLFVSELSRLYRVDGNLRAANLPALPVQYRDYAVWQRDWLTGQVVDGLLEYWRHQLAEAPAAVALPVAGRRSSAQGAVGGRVRSRLSREQTEALNLLCRSHGVTPFMILLATLATVLRRWSNQRDIVIGAPVSTRNDPATHNLIGFFVNTIPLRVDLSGDPSFAELLGRVRTVALGGYVHHGEAPLDVLVDQLQTPRDPTRTPLFQVILNMVDGVEDTTRLGDLVAVTTETPVQPSKFDLALNVQETRDGLRLELTFHADRYVADMMSTFLDQFAALLAAVVDDPTRGILDYPLVAGDATVVAGPERLDHPPSAAHLEVEKHALRVPDAIAVIDGCGQWNYQRLDNAATGVARAVTHRGLSQVRVVKRPTARFLATILGCMKAGVPFTLTDTGQPWSPGYPDTAVTLDPEPEDSGTGDVIDVRAWLDHETGPASEARQDIDASGHGTDWAVERFDLSGQDRIAVLSGSSDHLRSALGTAFAAGATVCVPDAGHTTDAEALTEWTRTNSITVAYVSPPVLRALAVQDAPPMLPTLRYVLVENDGNMTHHDVQAARRVGTSCRCVSVYRCAQAERPAAYFEVPDTWCQGDAPLRIPLGSAVDNAQIDVVNAAGQPAATGEVGEISFHARGTGDLGRRLADGTLEATGEGRGYAVADRPYADPIETVAALRDLPGVYDAVVCERLGVGDRATLVAYVASRDPELSAAGLRQYLTIRLPEYLVPEHLIVTEKLPLTPSGAHDLAALPDPGADGMPSTATYVPPRTPIERQLIDIFEELLDVERVSVHDTFFELGGFSLLATQLMSRVRETFKLELTLREVFEAPTVEGLAQLIVRAQAQLADAGDLQALLDEIE